MSAQIDFLDRLLDELIPTRVQVMGSLFLSLAMIAVSQSHELLSRIGVTQQAISASKDEFHANFDSILRSSIASHIALVTFWAIVGLVAYLVCWGAYNIMIEARNEVTLTTSYTNRGHWRGPWETLGLKTLSGIGLACVVSILLPGYSFWAALASQAVNHPSVLNTLWGIVAVGGFAVQLYAVLAFAQLTFTPWYRAEAFTDA